MVEFLTMTSREYRDFVTKNASFNPESTTTQQKTGRSVSKYRAIKAKADGKTFDSTKERDRYLTLKRAQSEGKIRGLECQKEFLLQEGFRDNTGKYQRPIVYICDFYYQDVASGNWVVEDVKSIVTRKLEVYRIKRKLFMFRYPEYKFLEAV
jgi:hypothetical protein